MEEMLRDVVRLFNAAYAALSTGKDRTTACAYYNLAQDKLTELEGYDAVGGEIRKARVQIRTHLLHEKSLHKRMETSAGFWAQVIGQLVE